MDTSCHFIGIGGIGMSGLANILLEKNVPVSGSDRQNSALMRFLEERGAKIFLGHRPQNISQSMTVIYTSAIKEDNPEFQAAIALKCPMLHRAELLAQLMEGYKTLAVTGTHGKTSTSALLAWTCIYAGLDPAFAVGGILQQLRTNAKHGEGEYFVIEADESDGSFLKYTPYGAIVTNIGWDHLDFYQSKEVLVKSFHTFIENVKTFLFWCGDDPGLRLLSPKGISYGFDEGCELRCSNFQQTGWTTTFDITFEGTYYSGIATTLIGKHQAANASAVFGLALRLGIEEKCIRDAFKTFCGVARRCEKQGENILFLDDYAHHPTEIAATLGAIRDAVKERRLIAVFQPHRYTRTRDCLGTFGKAFDASDLLLVTEIYAAGELPIEGIASENILSEIKSKGHVPSRIVSRDHIVEELVQIARPHDVIVTLGAGDITHVGGSVLHALKTTTRKRSKIKVGIVYGGQSVEHAISIKSAKFITESFNYDDYAISHFFIPEDGQWLSDNVVKKLQECDVLFPVLHGPFGEDGTIQGFFEMLGKPYIGMDFRAAAICMDKILTKMLAQQNGILTSPFIGFTEGEWKKNAVYLQEKIVAKLTFPLFVKAPHLGSSIGVYQVEEEKELPSAIEAVFRWDTHAMVENGIGGRELEFALFGNADMTVLPPGEICTEGKVYDYEAKYSTHAFKTMPQAPLSDTQLVLGKAFAENVYQCLGCSGMARVDTFLDKEGRFWLNEVNPIPGFTSISLFPQICAVHGISSSQLIDRLVILAMERRRSKQKKQTCGNWKETISL